VTAHQEISRPDKVLYPEPGWTKADIAEHYERVAGVLLPHLEGRPLVTHRFPDGVDDAGFFQKQAPAHPPVDTVKVPSGNSRGEVEHLLVDDVEGLRFLANQAAIELHRWLSRADGPGVDHPDLLVIDLDPPAKPALDALRATARATRDLFTEIGLTPYLLATGGSGYHVVAPLDRSAGFDDARALSRAIADRLIVGDPDGLTVEQRKAKRGNRIFLDTNRNAYGQTVVVPYSPRARAGAPVAVPITWDELGRVAPDGYDIASVRRRLAQQRDDPWAGMNEHAAAVADAAEALRALD
jgi:bifunctional non-homologous end joining protein LigD